jgi:hypothetical protein
MPGVAVYRQYTKISAEQRTADTEHEDQLRVYASDQYQEFKKISKLTIY